MRYDEVKGNLIELALGDNFEVIAHGCNCFCIQRKGLALNMANTFGTNKFPMEKIGCGDINKLGQIDYRGVPNGDDYLTVINCYTQYNLASSNNPIVGDYLAIAMCMRKINKVFKGRRIGLPKIGCGLAGLQWELIKKIYKQELVDCDVTVVIKD